MTTTCTLVRKRIKIYRYREKSCYLITGLTLVGTGEVDERAVKKLIQLIIQRKNSGKDHMMNFVNMSVSRNSMWAARPMNVFKFLPWEDVSKFTSHRNNTRLSDEGAEIWSKQLVSISMKIFAFFDRSNEYAWHSSILEEW